LRGMVDPRLQSHRKSDREAVVDDEGMACIRIQWVWAEYC
jgi:hypothetical protein